MKEILKKNQYLAKIVRGEDSIVLKLPENVLLGKSKSSVRYSILNDKVKIGRKTISCPNYASRLFVVYNIILRCEVIDYPSYLILYQDKNGEEFMANEDIDRTTTFLTKRFQNELDHLNEVILNDVMIGDNEPEENVRVGYETILKMVGEMQ